MEVKKTPVYDEHLKLNALIAPFSGWEMPIHYGSIIDETKHTRLACSVFDICHMGELYVRENPAKSTLDKIITTPVTKMTAGKCRYGFLLNEKGTVIDDLIAYRLSEDEWMIVVNASNEEIDSLTISSKLSPLAKFENRSDITAKFDIQGPLSADVMSKIAGEEIKELKYYSFSVFDVLGEKCIISRTGYTGELGYELYISSAKAAEAWNLILAQEGVKPAGLGSRDILRLEMGLPLYGDEMTTDITPLEAGFGKFIDFEKDFEGKEALVKQKQEGIKRNLRGFVAEGRRAPRHENRILVSGKKAGFVTSGCFSPHLNKGMGMGYIESKYNIDESGVEIDTGKGIIKAEIVKVPFIKETSIKKI